MSKNKQVEGQADTQTDRYHWGAGVSGRGQLPAQTEEEWRGPRSIYHSPTCLSRAGAPKEDKVAVWSQPLASLRIPDLCMPCRFIQTDLSAPT